MTPALRGALAVLASVLVGALIAQGIGRLALGFIGDKGPSNGLVAAGIVANVFLVPLAAGLVLGLIARRSLLALSFASVVLSLLATFIVAGAAGVPQAAKVFTYITQWALVYLAARFGARLARPQPS